MKLSPDNKRRQVERFNKQIHPNTKGHHPGFQGKFAFFSDLSEVYVYEGQVPYYTNALTG